MRFNNERQAPDNDGQGAPSSLFSPDLEFIETFLDLIGDREVRMESDWRTVVLEPAPTSSNALADEILASMQTPLRHFWFGAVIYPGKPASWPYAHDHCGSWRMMVASRAKTKCGCGGPGKFRKINIPWHDANRHGRPNPPTRKRSR